jgi:hypothetical protein
MKCAKYAKLLFLAICVLTGLAGCATKAPTTQEVKIPIFTPCVKMAPSRPTFATAALTPASSDGEKVLAIARDLPMHLKYEGELEAAIAGCL